MTSRTRPTASPATSMDPVNQSTQSRHPGRATLRTVVAVAVALLPLIPEIIADLHLGSTATGAQTIVIAAGVTRLLARKDVEALLHRYAPWLAAQPPPASLGAREQNQ